MSAPRGVATSSQVSVVTGIAEVVVLTAPPARGVKAGQKVLIKAFLQEQTDAVSTDIDIRIRRGSLVSGELVFGPVRHTQAASSNVSVELLAVDNATVDDPVYSLTGTNATGTGSALRSGISVTPIG